MSTKADQIHHDGKPVSWCGSCGTYMPRHTCEWKVLIGVVLGSGIVSIVGVIIMRSLL